MTKPDVEMLFARLSPALAGLVTAIYELQIGATAVSDQQHPEWFNLRFPLSGNWWSRLDSGPVESMAPSFVQGPNTSLIDFGGHGGAMFGVGLMPAGWALLFGGTARDLANSSQPLARFMAADELRVAVDGLHILPDFTQRAALIETMLLRRMADRPKTQHAERVIALQSALINPAIGTVDALAQTTGLSMRTLERLCRLSMGFSPKLLLRRQRFMRMLGQMHLQSPADWPGFLDPFYSDQSHMIRDFHAFLGTPPNRYFSRPRPILAVATTRRMAMMGAPMQALPNRQTQSMDSLTAHV